MLKSESRLRTKAVDLLQGHSSRGQGGDHGGAGHRRQGLVTERGETPAACIPSTPIALVP